MHTIRMLFVVNTFYSVFEWYAQSTVKYADVGKSTILKTHEWFNNFSGFKPTRTLYSNWHGYWIYSCTLKY